MNLTFAIVSAALVVSLGDDPGRRAAPVRSPSYIADEVIAQPNGSIVLRGKVELNDVYLADELSCDVERGALRLRSAGEGMNEFLAVDANFCYFLSVSSRQR